MRRTDPASRERLLDAATTLMMIHGYAATSLDRVCEAAGLTKGALFHHFGSKEELAKAALERFCDGGVAMVRQARRTEAIGVTARLRELLDTFVARYDDPLRQGCLIGMFTQELAGPDDVMRAKCDRSFHRMAREVEALLEEAQVGADPSRRYDSTSLAEYFLIVLEGSLVLARSKGDARPLRSGFDHFLRYVEGIVAGRL